MKIVPLLVAILIFMGVVIFSGSKNRDRGSEVDLSELEEIKGLDKATFAGGCFWGMEKAFDQLEGVVEAVSGYTGGNVENPTYEQVSTGETGHYEAVKVYYDPEKVSYQDLLEVFWGHIDPTDPKGQFPDRGSQYRTAIFYHNNQQKELAIQSKRELQESNKYDSPIVTDILPSKEFYPAEDYHQNYYGEGSTGYGSYKKPSGGEDNIERQNGGNEMENRNSTGFWEDYQKPSKEELKERLTDLQYKVTQKSATEPPFDNKYCDNKEEGIYVDVVSGEPLFSSNEKIDSGTGWPSFYAALEPENIVERDDYSLMGKRIEVRSKHADSHLGHLFYDGPQPTGKRYCINSAALKFIPKENLEEEGYSEYTELFK